MQPTSPEEIEGKRSIEQLEASRYASVFRREAGWRLYLLVFGVPLVWLSTTLHIHNQLLAYAVALAACASAVLPSDVVLFGLLILAWSLGLPPTIIAAVAIVSLLCRMLLTSSALAFLMGKMPALSIWSLAKVQKEWRKRLRLKIFFLSGLVALLAFPFSRLYEVLSSNAAGLREYIHVDVNQLYAAVLIGTVTVVTGVVRWMRRKFLFGEPAYDDLLAEAFWLLLTVFVALIPAALVASWPAVLLASVAVPFAVLRMRWYQKLESNERATHDHPRGHIWQRVLTGITGRLPRRTEFGILRYHAHEAVDRALDDTLFASFADEEEIVSDQETRARIEDALNEAMHRMRKELTGVISKMWARPEEAVQSRAVAAGETTVDRESSNLLPDPSLEAVERLLDQNDAIGTLRMRTPSALVFSNELMLFALRRKLIVLSYPSLEEKSCLHVGKLFHRVQSAALSPCSNVIAIGMKGAVQLCTPTSRLSDGPLEHPGNVLSLSFHPSGEVLASASNNNLVRVWNMSDKSLRYEFSRDGLAFSSVCFSGDGTTLAVGASDGRIYVLDAMGGQLDHVFVHSPGPLSARVNAVAVSSDGRTMISGGYDGETKLWDLEEKRCLGISEVRGVVHSVAFSSDASLFAAATRKSATVWDTESQRHVLSIVFLKDPFVKDVAFSPLGDVLAVTTFGTTVRLFGIPAGIPERVRSLTVIGFDSSSSQITEVQSRLAVDEFDDALAACEDWRHGQSAPISGIDSIDEDLYNLLSIDMSLPFSEHHRWALISYAVQRGVSDGCLLSLLIRLRNVVLRQTTAAQWRQKLLKNGVDEHTYPLALSFATLEADDVDGAMEALRSMAPLDWDLAVRDMWMAWVETKASSLHDPDYSAVRQLFGILVPRVLGVLERLSGQDVPWWLRVFLSNNLIDYQYGAHEFDPSRAVSIRAARIQILGLPDLVAEHVLRVQDTAAFGAFRPPSRGSE